MTADEKRSGPPEPPTAAKTDDDTRNRARDAATHVGAAGAGAAAAAVGMRTTEAEAEEAPMQEVSQLDADPLESIDAPGIGAGPFRSAGSPGSASSAPASAPASPSSSGPSSSASGASTSSSAPPPPPQVMDDSSGSSSAAANVNVTQVVQQQNVVHGGYKYDQDDKYDDKYDDQYKEDDQYKDDDQYHDNIDDQHHDNIDDQYEDPDAGQQAGGLQGIQPLTPEQLANLNPDDFTVPANKADLFGPGQGASEVENLGPPSSLPDQGGEPSDDPPLDT